MTQSEFNSAFQNMTIQQLGPAPHDPRYVTDQILRRDQRRTRVLAFLSLLFWLIGTAGMLLMVMGLNRFIGLMRIGDFPWNTHNALGWSVPLEEQVAWGTDLLHHSIPFIECSIVSLMLAALFTVMLIFSSRQATLNRINISLMEMSNQLKQRPDVQINSEGSAPPPIAWQKPRQPLLIAIVAVLALLGCGMAVTIITYLTLAIVPAHAWQGYPMLSPFQVVRYKGETPQVEVAGKWYELLAINDVPVEQIIATSKSLGSTTWQKHFEEDLVELLTKMGHSPGMSATLRVKDISSQVELTLNDVPMTGENRWALWRARQNTPATRPASQ